MLGDGLGEVMSVEEDARQARYNAQAASDAIQEMKHRIIERTNTLEWLLQAIREENQRLFERVGHLEEAANDREKDVVLRERDEARAEAEKYREALQDIADRWEDDTPHSRQHDPATCSAVVCVAKRAL
jgi:sugar-specific transcriptional regulator TrmB